MVHRGGTSRARKVSLLSGVSFSLLVCVCSASAFAEEGGGDKSGIDPALVQNPGSYFLKKIQPDTLDANHNPTFTTQLFGSSRATLLGDAGGARTFLGRYGITLQAVEISEVLGNATGGTKQGAVYEGLTTATLQVDTLRAFGLVGGTFNASALQIHGGNLSASNLLSLQTASGIEANRATRLWELWYDQAFNNGAFDIKLGQQSIDQEYITSTGSALFVNTMMGWPLLPSYNMYAGGPAYPLSSLGIRIKGDLAPHLTGLLGVYDDNPPGGPFANDAQTRGLEAGGVRFNLNTGALILGELQYAWNQPSTGDLVTKDLGLPGTYKLGFWYDTAKFPDQRFDTNGVALASPASSGNPAMERGNFSVYGVVDQVIWRPDAYEPKALSVFARIMGAPQDRNLISFSTNAGVTLKAPFKGRDNDTVGIGFGVGTLSSGAIGSDYDTARFAGPGTFSPVRSLETFIEATYQYQLAPWWNLQPDFQYIIRPGGGIVDPNNANRLVGNELIYGLRTTITF